MQNISTILSSKNPVCSHILHSTDAVGPRLDSDNGPREKNGMHLNNQDIAIMIIIPQMSIAVTWWVAMTARENLMEWTLEWITPSILLLSQAGVTNKVDNLIDSDIYSSCTEDHNYSSTINLVRFQTNTVRRNPNKRREYEHDPNASRDAKLAGPGVHFGGDSLQNVDQERSNEIN